MSRHSRIKFLRFHVESPYGTAPGSWAAASAVLGMNFEHRIVRDVVSRDLVRPWMGGSEHLIGARVAEITFDVELAGSGTADLPPAWGPLLRGCGMAQNIFAASRVEYTPVSLDHESLSFQYIIDGIAYVSRGARGTVQFVMDAYKIGALRFKFTGFDTAANTTDVTFGASSFTAWQRPVVITDANAGDIRLGGTYSTGVVSGGTVLASQGLTVDLGNEVTHHPLLGGEKVIIANRDASGRMAVELTAAQEQAWRTDINTNVLATLGFNMGTTAGNRITVFAPAVQRVDPQARDLNGLHMVEAELRFLPTGDGDNEIRIVSR